MAHQWRIHPPIRRCSTLFGGATRGSRPLHQQQRGDANGPSVPRSGLAPHCAIGDACHWPAPRLAIVSFGAFCRKLARLGVAGGGGPRNVIPAAGQSFVTADGGRRARRSLSLVCLCEDSRRSGARRAVRWTPSRVDLGISGSREIRNPGHQLAVRSQREP